MRLITWLRARRVCGLSSAGGVGQEGTSTVSDAIQLAFVVVAGWAVVAAACALTGLAAVLPREGSLAAVARLAVAASLRRPPFRSLPLRPTSPLGGLLVGRPLPRAGAAGAGAAVGALASVNRMGVRVGAPRMRGLVVVAVGVLARVVVVVGVAKVDGAVGIGVAVVVAVAVAVVAGVVVVVGVARLVAAVIADEATVVAVVGASIVGMVIMVVMIGALGAVMVVVVAVAAFGVVVAATMLAPLTPASMGVGVTPWSA